MFLLGLSEVSERPLLGSNDRTPVSDVKPPIQSSSGPPGCPDGSDGSAVHGFLDAGVQGSRARSAEKLSPQIFLAPFIYLEKTETSLGRNHV